MEVSPPFDTKSRNAYVERQNSQRSMLLFITLKELFNRSPVLMRVLTSNSDRISNNKPRKIETTKTCTDILRELMHREIQDHPPCSRHLTSCDVFDPFNKTLKGHRFASRLKIHATVNPFFS